MTRDEAIRQRLKQIPKSMRSTYKRAVEGRSRTMAIKAFCQECVGYERAVVRDCPSVACPLWPYRPYQTSDDDDA